MPSSSSSSASSSSSSSSGISSSSSSSSGIVILGDKIHLRYVESALEWRLYYHGIIARKLGPDQCTPQGTYVFESGPCAGQPIYIL